MTLHGRGSKVGRMGPVVSMASMHANMPKKSGTLTGMRYDWDDHSTVVLDIESGAGHSKEMQTVRVPKGESEQFKLGQRITVETKIAGE